MSEWQLHFRNISKSTLQVRCHHAGCGLIPWHDDRPGCWTADVPYSPTGDPSGNNVYRPSSWVINFNEWFALIKDGLKLIKSIGMLFVPPYPPTRKEFKKSLKSIFAVASDIIDLCVDNLSDAEFNELFLKAHDSIKNSAKAVGLTEYEVESMARELRLGNDWAFIAGPAYWENIHDSHSPVVGSHGWSIFRDFGGNDLKIANGCFIHNGHLIYLISEADKLENQLWSPKKNGEWTWP